MPCQWWYSPYHGNWYQITILQVTATDWNQSRSLKFDSLKIQKQLSVDFISKRERHASCQKIIYTDKKKAEKDDME